MSLVTEGHNVKVHYKGTLEDGTEFDNSRTRGAALEFQVGVGQMIKGFDEAVRGMGLGEVKIVTIPSTDAYGPVHTEAFRDFPRDAFGETHDLQVDGVVQGQSPDGQPMVARISALDETTVTLDLNHPLAGKDLIFEIEMLEITQ
tara:strand:+ start:8301 stop:8735 length:435 start_codon:yes stop_codon:yes gene_type:complete